MTLWAMLVLEGGMAFLAPYQSQKLYQTFTNLIHLETIPVPQSRPCKHCSSDANLSAMPQHLFILNPSSIHLPSILNLTSTQLQSIFSPSSIHL